MNDLVLPNATVLLGDCVERMRGLPAGSAQMCVTSPPYFGLRDYGVDGQLGLEKTPEQYVANMVEVFRHVRDVLSDDGTLWLNIGDSYASTSTYNAPRTSKGESGRVEAPRQPNVGIPPGCKAKDLIGIPWMLAFALRADGWYLRQDIIWHKPNPMPESVRDRCTKAHEYVFLMSKSERYFFDNKAMQEPAIYAPGKTTEVERPKGYYGGKWKDPSDGSRNDGSFKAIRETRYRRSVWTVATRPYKGAHFATFPPALIEPCILAGSRPGDVVLDPFNGSGTTGQVALQHGREYLGIELNPEYVKLTRKRLEAAIASNADEPQTELDLAAS